MIGEQNMKKKIKFIALMLISGLILFNFNVMSAENLTEMEQMTREQIENKKRIAGVDFSDNKENKTNCTVYTSNISTQVVDGRMAYVKNSTSNAFVDIDIDDDYWYSEEANRVKITIEYKDMPGACFSVHYNSSDGSNWAYPGTFNTQGTNEWKTYVVYLDDFAPSLPLEYGSGDIRIRSAGWHGYATNPLCYGKILIEENVGEYKLEVSANNGYVGRIFDYGGSDEMTLDYENMHEDIMKASGSYEILNNEGRKISSGEVPEFSLGKREKVSKKINIGALNCGTYTMKLQTSSFIGNTEESYEREFEFSVVRTKKKDDKNFEMAGAVAHLNQYTSGLEKSIEVMSRIGVSSVREEITWNDYEKTPETYVLADKSRKHLRSMWDKGIKNMVLFYGANTNYAPTGGMNDFHDDEDEIKAFGTAVKQAMLNEVSKDMTEYIEVLNEWNLSTFNPIGLGQEVYIKYLKAAYEAAKSVNPDIKVVAGSYAGFDQGSLRTFLQSGGLQYCDVLSYHPYQGNRISLDTVTSQTETARQMMMEYAGEVKPIVLSEFGWPTADGDKDSITEEQRRRAVPAYYLYSYANEYIEKIYYYDFVRDGIDRTAREHNFGLLKFNEGHNDMAATDTFVTFAAMNNLIQDAKPAGKIEKEGVYAYQYQKRDGKKLASLWTMGRTERVALDLGVNEILMYDMYGTLVDTLKSENGIFTFDLSDEIIYIQGDFKSFKVADPIIYQKEPVVNALTKDAFNIVLQNGTKKDLKVRLDYDDEIFAVRDTQYLSSGEIVVEIDVADIPKSTKHIDIALYDESGVYYSGKVKVDVTSERLKINFDCKQQDEKNDRRWVAATTIENISQRVPISGKCYISQPAEYAQEVRRFSNIAPGAVRHINLNLPEMVVKRPEYLTITVELDNGEKFEETIKLDFTTALYTEEKPIIDGVKSKTELWNKTAVLVEDRKDRFDVYSGGEWRGTTDCSLIYRMLWDLENLYFFINVKDDVFSQNEIPSNMWNGDSIQFGILERLSGIESTANTFTELCIALTKEGPNIFRHSSCGGKPVSKITDFEAAILRNQGETIYELAIPWAELFNEDYKVKPEVRYRFSLLVNDNDGDSVRHGWLNYNDGIGTVKNSQFFGDLTLRK